MKSFVVLEGENIRLDVFLKRYFDAHSRSKIQQTIAQGAVKIDGKICTQSSLILKVGMLVEYDDNLLGASEEHQHLESKQIPLEIVFENENLLVINKQPGLTTHPGAGNQSDTLVNALLFRYKEGELADGRGVQKLGIVHRLDKDTSGLMLVAKNNVAQYSLSQQIAEKTCKRTYLALCYGVAVPSSGVIETYLDKDPKDHRKVVVASSGKLAITEYRTMEVFANGALSLVQLQLQTGRTHQIRAHLLHKKHPIVGDKVYTSAMYTKLSATITPEQKAAITLFGRQALHSCDISFDEPVSGERLHFACDLYKDIADIIAILRS
jgi:23S rRNA pseudouridine1911/1915/1917 synthase